LADGSFQLVSRQGLTWLECTAFAEFPWLVHAFSTRLTARAAKRGGAIRDFHLGLAGGANPRSVEANRRRFCAALGGRWTQARLRQIHSAIVYEAVSVDSDGSPKGKAVRLKAVEYRPAGWPMPHWAQISETDALGTPSSQSDRSGAENGHTPAGDALLTAEPGILLTVRTADCLPVLLVDARLRVIAAVHAGWRGALARVIEKTVGELRRMFGSAPGNLVAALGPAIGSCCYEVGDEVVDAFRAQFIEGESFFCRPPLDKGAAQFRSRYSLLFDTQAPPGHRRERAKLHLDLATVAHVQLTAAGLKPAAIHHSGFCTACHADLFFSYRREGAQAGRMMAAIGMRA
jgi:polyphenol oxidase